MIGERPGRIVDTTVIADAPDSADQLRSLYEWLGNDDELRGRVSPQESPPVPGTLGPVLDALTIAAGPGGVATVFAASVIAWLRGRRGDVSIKVTSPDDWSVELNAQRVASLDARALQEQVTELSTMLSEDAGRRR